MLGTVFWRFSDDLKYLSSCHKEKDNCPNLLFVRKCLCRSLLLQLGFTCSTAADKLRFLYSKILSVYERSIKVFLFFLVFFTLESGNLLIYMKNIHFLSLERPMETSWRNTA